MTLDALNAHLYLLNRLTEAQEMLQSMRDAVLKASSYDGMPHGGGVYDKVGALAIKIAEQEETVKKYVWRYHWKNGAEDLKKARFYMGRLIAEVEL